MKFHKRRPWENILLNSWFQYHKNSHKIHRKNRFLYPRINEIAKFTPHLNPSALDIFRHWKYHKYETHKQFPSKFTLRCFCSELKQHTGWEAKFLIFLIRGKIYSVLICNWNLLAIFFFIEFFYTLKTRNEEEKFFFLEKIDEIYFFWWDSEI